MLNSLLLLRQQTAQELGQVGGGEPAVMDTRDFLEKEQTSAEMNRRALAAHEGLAIQAATAMEPAPLQRGLLHEVALS